MLEIIRDRYHPLMMRVSTASFDKIGILPIIVNICFLFIWFGYVVFVYFPMIAVVQDKFSGFNLKVSRLSVVFMIGVFLFLGSFPRDLQISKLLDFNAALFTNPLGFALPSLFTMIVESRFSLKSLFGFFLFCGSILLSIKVIYGMLAQ
ncbi:hypothetical protein PAEPH01_1952 [Pancytospora epiphaga]|nr:hypothetical protein PAEPH01_1952 [Pancytospora epiphaga]